MHRSGSVPWKENGKKILKFDNRSGWMAERAEVSTALAFRVARLLDVSLYHVLTGEALPPDTCKHCGRTNYG
jgi:hypothetical protein